MSNDPRHRHNSGSGGHLGPSANRPPPDPFGHRRRVRELWRACERTASDDPEYPEVCYHLGIAWGCCVLSGTDTAEFAPTLPLPQAVQAVAFLTDRFLEWSRELPLLARRHADAESPTEADEVAFRWVRVRTDVWALLEAVRQAEEAAQDAGDPNAEELSRAFDAVWPRLDQLDRQLDGCKQVLVTQLHSARVQALRASLLPAFRDPLPWWLDPASFPAEEVEPPFTV